MTEDMNQILSYGSRQIAYQLHIMPRKRLRLVVTPDMSVHAYAPETFCEDEILTAIQAKAPWIARHLDAMREFHPLPAPHRYLSGVTFMYLGRQYRLRVGQGDPVPAKLRGRFLHVAVADKTDAAATRKSVDAWYRLRADEIFHRYLDRCMQVASRHGVKEPTVTIRSMRTRWGSCSPSGRITLNLNLIQTPVHCVEYVVMHELCHLVHLNHSKPFYQLLARCMPDWERRRAVLTQIAIAGQHGSLAL